jgi:hypothetical protein
MSDDGARKVHIAGLQVQVGALLRQRCGWCGELLLDYDLRSIAVEPGTTVEEVTGGFEPGVLLEVQGTNPKSFTVLEHVDGEQIPAGFCGDDGEPRIKLQPPATSAQNGGPACACDDGYLLHPRAVGDEQAVECPVCKPEADPG